MIRSGTLVFVDSGVWIALALSRDPLHEQAVSAWKTVTESGAFLRTSIPVVIETFTFLERNARRDVALSWKDSLESVERFAILQCSPDDLDEAWTYFRRPELHKLSAVDATSFVLMEQEGIRHALAFDHHFASVGFRLVG